MKPENIPAELRKLKSWCLWKTVQRNGKPTKVPFQPTDYEAESNNPETWCGFDDAMDRYAAGGYDGLGFMFGAEPSGFVGVDLDGCRCPDSGAVEEWAKEIILKLASYAEVSPSQSGVKIFLRGKSPFSGGKNLKLKHLPPVGGKSPGIEIYDHGRYFAVTGLRVRGPLTCNERQNELDWLKGKFWPDAVQVSGGDFYGDDSVLERARKYVAKCPPAISGQNGSASAFSVACRLVCGFGLSRETALVLFREWNQTCKPPWTEKELEHKIDDAAKQAGTRNYLRNVQPARWESIPVPTYTEPSTNGHAPKRSTLADAARDYVEYVKSGGGQRLTTGIAALDKSMDGGLPTGELILVAARPSHGKSMLALQFMHAWSALKMPCLFISEEMPKLMLGKRALQFISERPKDKWREAPEELCAEIEAFAATRETCHLIENCGTCDVAVSQAEEYIEKHGVKAVVIDYAQCLKSKGKDIYEQVTNTSLALRGLAHRHKDVVTIALCHMGRDIEKRKGFIPTLADLKNSGQLEQDADVVLFLVWPWKLDNSRPVDGYQIFPSKNRNGEIHNSIVECNFDARRQIVTDCPSPYANDFNSPPEATDDAYWDQKEF